MNDADRKRLIWSILVVGFAIPWMVGALVKLFLDSRGVSTVDWGYFLSPKELPFSVLLTFWLGSPYVYLAFNSRVSKGRSIKSIMTAFGLAITGSIFLYLCVWQHIFLLIMSLIWLPIPPFLLMLVGFAITGQTSNK